VAELGGIAAALAASGFWLAVSPRGALLPASVVRRLALRRAGLALGLLFFGLSLVIFLRGGALAAAILQWITAVTLGFSLLVLAAATTPRLTRALVLLGALVAVSVLMLGGGAGGGH
jgi:hypothetical protein